MNDERTTVDVGDLLAPGGRVFYTADPHYEHPRIIELSGRPFRDVKHMNDVLVSNHNSVVGPGDTCIVLGDFMLGAGFHENIQLAGRLNGRLILMPGNHDRVAHTYFRKRPAGARNRLYEEFLAVYKEYFHEVLSDLDHVTRHIPEAGETVILSHYPYEGDSHDADRFSEMRPTDDGRSIVVHGHVHERWQVNGRQLNVGVDVNWFTPVSEETLVQRIHEVRL